jgi:hypothetical protein
VTPERGAAAGRYAATVIAAVELPSLEQFLIHWYGPAPQPGALPDADFSEAPEALAHWYRLAARWPHLTQQAQNHLAAPNELTMEDGKCLFWLESQGVWEWAFEPDQPNPMVFDRETDSGQAWHPTGIVLSEFLVQVAMFERVMNGTLGAAAHGLNPQQLAAALAPMHALNLPAWRWPPPSMQFYLGPDLLAMAGGQDDLAGGHDDLAGGHDIFVAGRNAAALAYLAGTGVAWEAQTRA